MIKLIDAFLAQFGYINQNDIAEIKCQMATQSYEVLKNYDHDFCMSVLKRQVMADILGNAEAHIHWDKSDDGLQASLSAKLFVVKKK